MTKIHISIMENIPTEPCVRIAYDHQIADLLIRLSKYASWSRLAQIYGISKGTLNAYSRGRKIKNPAHRRIFGLPEFVNIPACPVCGKVHLRQHPHERKPTDTTPEAKRRRAIDRLTGAVKYAVKCGVNVNEFMREVTE